MLSHYYDAGLVSLNISLRDNKVVSGTEVLDQLTAEILAGKRVLVVDDICDSGDTLAAVWEHLGLANAVEEDEFIETNLVRAAVLWNNPGQDVFAPQYVARDIHRLEDPRWVIFPFEDWWER